MKKLVENLLHGNPLRPGLDRQEKPSQMYFLSEMMKTLAVLTEEQWGLYAFSREPLRGRISLDERVRLAGEAAACGREEAVRLRVELGALSPECCAERLGLEIRREPKANDGGFVFFAQFQPPRRITLFTDCLDRAADLLRQNEGMPFQNIGEIEDLLLAHELFHYVEEQRGEALYTQSQRLTLWSLGPLHSTSRISCLSEIAGMAFAGELCGAGYSPYLLDVFLVYGYQQEAASNLYEGVIRVTSKSKDERG